MEGGSDENPSPESEGEPEVIIYTGGEEEEEEEVQEPEFTASNDDSLTKKKKKKQKRRTGNRRRRGPRSRVVVIEDPLTEGEKTWMEESGMEVPGYGDAIPEELTREEKIKMLQEQKAVFLIEEASGEYGMHHRKSVCAIDIQPCTRFHVERAMVYVAAGVEPETQEEKDKEGSDVKFFTGQGLYNRCPAPFLGIKGCMHVYMTCLLIKDYPKKARMFLGHVEGVSGLFGRVNENSSHFCTPMQAWPISNDQILRHIEPPEERAYWTLDKFARLYGVVQVNAVLGRMPLRDGCYGLGFFPGVCFINHSCVPNAVRIMVPGRIYIQSLRSIREGDEITVAYHEFPTDLLGKRMALFLQHQWLGFECRCAMCTAVAMEEGAAPQQGVSDIPAEGEGDANVIDIDMTKDPFTELWCDEVKAKLSVDMRLRSMVTQMVHKASQVGEGGEMAAAAAFILREHYAHLFTPPAPGKPPLDYCGELAYVLGEVFCNIVMHHPSASLEDVAWWPMIWLGSMQSSVIDLPLTTSRGLLARAYSGILLGISREDEDNDEDRHAKAQTADFELFLCNWIALRALHNAVFGHVAFLTVEMLSHDVIHHAVTTSKSVINKMEVHLLLQDATEEPPAEGASSSTTEANGKEKGGGEKEEEDK